MSIVQVEKNFENIMKNRAYLEVTCSDKPVADLYKFSNATMKIVLSENK
jgi:hypothetical protein